jgi:hypothetical protein
MKNIKPISEIYLRVRGELKLLGIALQNNDSEKIMKHRVTLHRLIDDFEISLKDNKEGLIVHYKIKEISTNLLMLAQATLHNASRYLSMSICCP